MNYIYAIFFFLFGTIVGSFLNSITLRYNTGFRKTARSICFSCGKELCWYELIPVISYLVQRGRCTKCGEKISVQYPLIELLSGLIFLLVYLKDGITLEAGIVLFSFSLLISILIYDVHHKIIPTLHVTIFNATALLLLFVSGNTLMLSFPPIIDIFAGILLASFFAILWLISKGRWMGLGDAKLALGIGWILGLEMGVTALLVSFWAGALAGIIIIAFQRVQLILQEKEWGKRKLKGESERITMKSEVPFAPFLIFGLWLVYFSSLTLV